MAPAICCVCEGSSFSNCASGPPTCSECETVCNNVGATMRACCNAPDCDEGVADACVIGTLCQQVEVGPGFCDGTCTDAPAAAEAPVVSPAVLLLALVLLGGLGAFDLARRARRGGSS
ncbi:MAG: hypothetical protein ACRERC_09205 [Candidatus Binatia bacterium]